MTPEQLVLLLLVGLSAVLTIVLLGCLRSLADLRLELASARRGRMSGEALAAGLPLPEFLARELPWLHEDGLILFLSTDCPLCAELVSILPKLRIGNVAFALLGEGGEGFEAKVAGFGDILSSETTRAAAEHFYLEYIPIGIHQRDGVIIGSIHTEALVSPEEIERFWQFSGARLLEAAA